METVEVVIKIPKFVYDMTKAQKKVIDADVEIIGKAISEGIVLPKNHRRLIILSEDAIKREQTFLGSSCQSWISDTSLSDATVAIIEADTESEEKEK